MSSHRLEIEAGKWFRSNRIPIEERKCSICHILEHEFHFVIESSIYIYRLKKNTYLSKVLENTKFV